MDAGVFKFYATNKNKKIFALLNMVKLDHASRYHN